MGQQPKINSLEGCCPVSIHAPARGATRVPRCHHGGGGVSIHAPARGATAPEVMAEERTSSFQFTHPQGVRHVIILDESSLFKFQFTHPRGVRHVYVGAHWSDILFQFTHPQGVRPHHRHSHLTEDLFQFTHPRGVRQQIKAFSNYCIDVSIHSPARGATADQSLLQLLHRCFNSRTHEGCDSRPAIPIGYA